MNDEVVQFLEQAIERLSEQKDETFAPAHASDIERILEHIQAAANQLRNVKRNSSKHPSQRTATTYFGILDHIPDGLLTASAEGEIVELNRAAAQLFKCSRAGLLGTNITALVAEKQRKAFYAAMLKLGPKHAEQEWELELLRGSEGAFPARVVASFVPGKPKRIQWLVHDLSDAKRAAKTKQRYEFLSYASQLLSAAPDFVTRVERVTRLAVPAFADLCVLHVRDAQGQTLKIQVAHADPAQEQRVAGIEARYWLDSAPPTRTPDAVPIEKRRFHARMTDDLLSEISHAQEHMDVLKDLGLISFISVPLKTHSRSFGSVMFATASSGRTYEQEDLTHAEAFARRAALAIENALRYEEAQQEIAERERSLVLALQEIKTPVSVIQNLAQVVKSRLQYAPMPTTLQPGTDAGQETADMLQEHLEHISRSSERLLGIVNDIHALMRMQKRTLKLQPSWVNLTELVHSVSESMRILQTDGRYPRDVKIEISAPDTPQMVVKADKERLAQVVSHLLDNALKYSPRGGTVTCRLELEELDESPYSPQAHLVVCDEGIGVPLSEQSRIFQPFVRATNTEGRNISGIGVGLALCYEIITRHEGRIWVESNGADCGSAFHIILPKVEFEVE